MDTGSPTLDGASRRRAFGGLFLLGVACGIVLACLIAAYDLWGGVPRDLWLMTRVFGGLGITCLSLGAIGWISSWPAEQRLRASLKAAGALAVLCAVGGAALFAHYMIRWDTSRRICAPALIAPTRAERDAALREGLGPLFPIIDPHSSCLQLERERRSLDKTGDCPTFVMNDAPCRCGAERWSPPATPGCPSGPTACAYRAETKTSGLGCPIQGNQYTLEQARKAAEERKSGR